MKKPATNNFSRTWNKAPAYWTTQALRLASKTNHLSEQEQELFEAVLTEVLEQNKQGGYKLDCVDIDTRIGKRFKARTCIYK